MSAVIAIIDNDEAVCATLTALAHDEGWTVSGMRYEEASLAGLQEINPDLIVLDFDKFWMGGGWEFLQLLKMETSTAAIPIIVAAVAFDLPMELKGYLASRNIVVVSKPLDLENCIAVARHLLAGRSALLPAKDKGLPILLVEDNLPLAETFLSILEMEGYLASTVPNGQLALDALRSGQYSLIFLDMSMPVMTGREFIAAYALQPGPHTPVVIFSTEEAETDDEVFPSFVIGRLPKVFEIRELLGVLTPYSEPAESDETAI